jgi:hypothetical protein
MKRKFFFFLLLSFILFAQWGFSQNRKAANFDTRNWRYEVQGVAEGKEGTYLLKVWSYSKNQNISIEQSKKNAVHAVIFQGYTGVGRVTSQLPICSKPGAEIEHKDYFDSFFADNGYYMKYVSMSSDGSVSGGDRLKVGKEYKVGVIVSVKKDLLKKDLEAAGIIKGLGYGF